MWKDTIKKNLMEEDENREGRAVSPDKVDLIGKYKLVRTLRKINEDLQLIGEDVLDSAIEGSKDLRELDMDSEDIIRFFSILSQALLKEYNAFQELYG